MPVMFVLTLHRKPGGKSMLSLLTPQYGTLNYCTFPTAVPGSTIWVEPSEEAVMASASLSNPNWAEECCMLRFT